MINYLNEGNIHEYEKFIEETPSALFYHSIKYKNFLNKILNNSTDKYILAYEEGNLVGCLPCFVKSEKNIGKILNSLPFYGSHGGMIISSSANNIFQIKLDLLSGFLKLAKDEEMLTATIIDHPLYPDEDFYQQSLGDTLLDTRISQITKLALEGEGDMSDKLMNRFHSKTRNLIRKGLKEGFHIYHQGGLDKMKMLQSIHEDNMQAIGGIPKPMRVFEAINDCFTYGEDYKVYFAESNNECAAALLVFYFKEYCEYFTPVINAKYRSQQPLSALIYTAMLEAINQEFKFWNWGGTHLSQENLRHFKSRWGTTDSEYKYYTKIMNEDIFQYEKSKILEHFPYFYVRPYK